MSSDTIKLYHIRTCLELGEAVAYYEQIPALIDRSKQRVANFYGDFDARLTEVPYVAGDEFSAADITMLVTVDFAARAFEIPIPPTCGTLQHWYDKVAARPGTTA
jgi:glutathione S-transferase